MCTRPARSATPYAAALPTLVVIRQPDDAVCSLLVAAPHVSARSALNEWIHHYEVLRPLAAGFVITSLPELVDDMASVIRRLNDRFGPIIDPARWTHDSASSVRQAIVAHHLKVHDGEPTSAPWPVEHRALMRDAAHQLLNDPELATLRRRADALFADFLALADSRMG